MKKILAICFASFLWAQVGFANTEMESIDSSRAALVIVEPLNFILNEKGFFAKKGCWKVAKKRGTIVNIQNLIAKARHANIPVIYSCFKLVPEILLKTSNFNQINVNRKDLEWNLSFIPELKPMKDDYVVKKTNAINGFSNPYFNQLLTGLNRDILIYAGVQTNNCVVGTVRGAADIGYTNIVVSNCVQSGDQEANTYFLKKVFPSLGCRVVDLDHLQFY